MIGPVYLNFGDKGRLPIYDGDIIFLNNKEDYHIKIKETRYSFHKFVVMYKKIGDVSNTLGINNMWFQTSSTKIFSENHYPIRKKVLERKKKLIKIG